jgi:hypothetical protein
MRLRAVIGSGQSAVAVTSMAMTLEQYAFGRIDGVPRPTIIKEQKLPNEDLLAIDAAVYRCR